MVGHGDLDPLKRDCPGFDVIEEFMDLQPAF